MKSLLQCVSAVLAFALLYAGMAHADSYADAISTFKGAGKSGAFFDKSYGYAVFPTIGGAGFLIGAAHGKGRVYAQGVLTGDTSMNLLSAGFQAGAKAGAGTTGTNSEASADSSDANTKGGYHNGMAVFTIAKGGLMYAATISGQKFTFTPRGGS
jgi:hypothetical protein